MSVHSVKSYCFSTVAIEWAGRQGLDVLLMPLFIAFNQEVDVHWADDDDLVKMEEVPLDRADCVRMDYYSASRLAVSTAHVIQDDTAVVRRTIQRDWQHHGWHADMSVVGFPSYNLVAPFR